MDIIGQKEFWRNIRMWLGDTKILITNKESTNENTPAETITSSDEVSTNKNFLAETITLIYKNTTDATILE